MTSTLSRPRERSALPGAARVCTAIAIGFLALAAIACAYVVVRAVGRLAAGDADGAALWATMLFAAFALVIPAYGAQRLGVWLRTAPRVDALAFAGPAAVVALCLVLQGIAGAGSYFVTDDWLHIVIAHDATTGSGLDLHYLGRIVFIHFAPGHRFSYWLLDELAPLNWTAAVAAMLALFGSSLLLFQRICTRLFGRSPWNLLLLGMFGTSILLVPSFLWFADGVHKFPSVLLTLIAIDAYLTYRLEARRSALAVCVAAVSLASLFYAKALLVPLYLVMIRVLFLERSPWTAVKAMARERWTWLAFAPTVAIYAVNYLANYSHVQAPPPSLELLGKYLVLAWFRGVTPSFAGVTVSIDAPPLELAMAFGAQVGLVLLIAASLHRKPTAWRAWVFLGIAFAANATVIALGRLGSLGLKQVGSQLRYDTEMAWLFPLAVGFAFFAHEVAARGGEPRAVRTVRLPRPRVAYALLALVVCGYLAARIDTGIDMASQWHRQASDPARAYASNLQRDAARLERSGARLAVMDDQTPVTLISPAHKPWNRLDRLVPAIAPQLHVGAVDPHPLQVRQDGEVIPIALQSLATDTEAITGAGRVELDGGRATGAHGRCAATGADPASLSFRTEEMVEGQSLFGRIAYEVRRGATAPALVTATDGYRDKPLALPLEPGRGQLYVNLGHRLVATLPPHSEVCLRSSAVGWLTP